MIPKGKKVITAHLRHLAAHHQHDYVRQALEVLRENNLPEPDFRTGTGESETQPEKSFSHPLPVSAPEGGCPGSRQQAFTPQSQRACPVQSPSPRPAASAGNTKTGDSLSELQQWPIQLHLISPTAPWLRKADLLIAADCTAYAAGDFHSNWLRGKLPTIACPKLDHGREIYLEKLATMIDEGGIDTMTAMIMEVPCCGGLLRLSQEARQKANRQVPLKVVKISLQGEIL